MPFIHDDFLLTNQAGKRLYHEHAAGQPIIDYHCHLSPQEIAENRRFANLFEVWLAGDHYKWRAMRANGVDERYCTGDADPYEKFLAWARTVPKTLRNPLYHWTHLELKRYFDIDDLLDEATAPAIWQRANERLASDELTAQGILAKFDVKAVCTTDDPTDSLEWHRKIADSGLPTRVFPAFRPDAALEVSAPNDFNAWTDRLGAVANLEIRNFTDFLDALKRRHDAFHEVGCRLSDHGINKCYADATSESVAASIFTRARDGHAAGADDQALFASFMMLFFGRLDEERGWTKQLHIGARRNANSRRLAELGPNTGFDSIGDWQQVQALGAYLDRLDQESALPRIVVYNNNPNDNYLVATMLGCFQDGAIPGKMQFGSGWWHLDQKEGMEWQLNTLSNVGLLSRFIGMLTDSRSFLSYPRHEYFRRILCNLLGRDIERGEIPDTPAVGRLVEDISFNNVRDYLRLPL